MYSYSINEEMYYGDFETREEAIKVGREKCIQQYGKARPFSTAENSAIKTEELIDIDFLVEDMQIRASDLCGESGEDYASELTEQDKKELLGIVSQFMRSKIGEPNIFAVINIEYHDFEISEQ